MSPILQYWYFHIPNFILAAVMYTVLGRIVLSLFVAPDWQNYIWRAFVRITEPAVAMTRVVTPAAVVPIVVLIFTFLWLMVLRVAWFAALASQGLLPVLAG
jgi:uncharacterized protein YggT (Ycf19 family)